MMERDDASIPSRAPQQAHRLTPDDAADYAIIRAEMLLDAPQAFLGAPGDDLPGEESWIEARLGQPEQAIFAIREGGRLASVAGLYRVERIKCRHRAAIWGVYTTPECRGRGFGRAVVQSAIEQAKRWNGVRFIALSVSAQAPAAQRLYEALGFKAWGTEPAAMSIDGRDLDEVHMVLRV